MRERSWAQRRRMSSGHSSEWTAAAGILYFGWKRIVKRASRCSPHGSAGLNHAMASRPSRALSIPIGRMSERCYLALSDNQRSSGPLSERTAVAGIQKMWRWRRFPGSASIESRKVQRTRTKWGRMSSGNSSEWTAKGSTMASEICHKRSTSQSDNILIRSKANKKCPMHPPSGSYISY